jgi:hypothetical protein
MWESQIAELDRPKSVRMVFVAIVARGKAVVRETQKRIRHRTAQPTLGAIMSNQCNKSRLKFALGGAMSNARDSSFEH